jgi:hypothetical protein
MTGRSPHSVPYSQGTEIDLREELSRTLYGAVDEVKKGRIGLLRKMRRNSSGELLRCVCRDNLTDEPDSDTYCRYCLGHGYYWDESKITYFKDDDSFRRHEGVTKEYEDSIFYVEYNVPVTDDDYIIEISVDSNGNVIIPIERIGFFKILKADPMRSDNGRIEFFQIRTKEERKWSVYYGVTNRQYN